MEDFASAAAHQRAYYGTHVNGVSPGSIVTPIHLDGAGDLGAPDCLARDELSYPDRDRGRLFHAPQLDALLEMLFAAVGATVRVDGGQTLGLPESLPGDLTLVAAEAT